MQMPSAGGEKGAVIKRVMEQEKGNERGRGPTVCIGK